jgi:NAD(P)-dependent dehydrogenase (short-subunit alcohol dehydrogenase family)
MFIDKVAIITGASRGIGLATSRRFHRDGARVALCARSADALNAHVAELGADRASAVTMDIRNPASVQAGIATIVRKLGKIDIVVNNAGISGITPIDAPSSEPWLDIVSTNLTGTYHVTRAALPHMPDGGRVLVISSVVGKFGVPGYSAYCASKTALIGFVRALALELASRKIAVNAICPGWTDTEMAWSVMRDNAGSRRVSVEEFKRDAMSQVPLGEMIQPNEVANLAAFLASDMGRNITAQAISICGGATQS